MAITSSTFATIAAIGSIAATAVNVGANIWQSKQQNKMYQEEARASEIQGELAMLNSRSEAAALSKEAQRTHASQVASAVGMGVDAGSGGTLTDIMNFTQYQYNLDKQQILQTGRLQNAAALYSAGATKQASRNNRITSLLNAGTSLLSGLDSTAVWGNRAGWFA